MSQRTATSVQASIVVDAPIDHGDGWDGLRESVGSDGGWPGCLRRFGERVAAGAALS